MVLYNDGNFVTNSAYPDTDFMGDADFVVADDSDLAQKIIRLYPNFDIVTDDEGGIADVTATEPVPAEEVPEPPTNAELAAAIAELAEVMCGG